MWRSLLISEILRGAWAIEPRIALSYAPFIIYLLSGKDDSSNVKLEELSVSAVADNDETFGTFDDAPRGSVAIVPLKGVMRKYDGLCSYGTQTISSIIRQAADHQNIDASVLDIDSGGGSVDSIPCVLESIQYSQSKGKPVVSHCDMAASAAYWAASATDYIFGSNTISSEFGSIGVMIQFMDYKAELEKDGAKLHTVYAPESTHKNLPFENALKGDYQAMQEDVLSPLAKIFQKAVKTNRKNLDTSVEGILNGKMFFAEQAVKNGLADKIGNLEMAIKQAKKLALSYSLTKK